MSGDTTSLMPFAFFLSLLPAMFGFATAEQSDQVRTLVVEQEVIMRIPIRPRPVQPYNWEEKKGPKCLDASSIRGAALPGRIVRGLSGARFLQRLLSDPRGWQDLRPARRYPLPDRA